MTTTEAAEKLGVCRSRIRQLILNGTIAATKHGRDWDITAAALRAARKRPGVGWPKGRKRKKEQ